MPSGVLFVHNNFPGQFRDLAQALAARGVRCAAIGSSAAPGVPGMPMGRYSLSQGSTPNIFPYATRAEADLIRGRCALDVARQMQAQGLDPKVIVGHPGWGETVFLDDAFPGAKQIMFHEFFYHGRGLDIDFDPGLGRVTDQSILMGKSKNAVQALALTDADAIVCPTPFQASTLPAVFKPLVRIIHEGIDVETIRPGPPAPFPLPDGRIIPVGTPLITYANNHMEPLRGLHIVARALPRLLAEVPDAQVLIFGNVHARPYGGAAADGRTWRDTFFEGLPIEAGRVHFLGKAPHDQLLAAMRRSTAHIYYSYPFVLSWSLVEAMASGCYVVASDTAPLRDAIEDGVNGRLLPFFDHEALTDALVAACRDPKASAPLRLAARETAVAKFSQADGRAAWMDLLREMGMRF